MREGGSSRATGAGRRAELRRSSWRLRASLLFAVATAVLGYASKSGAEPSQELHWSPDGQYLAASMWWPLKSGVTLFGPDGSPIRRVTEKDDWVQWVEGDRLLTGKVVLSGDESWSLMDLEGKRLEVIWPDVTLRSRQLTTGVWRTSPDGRYLVYTCIYSPEGKSHYAVVLYRFSDHRSFRFSIGWWDGDSTIVWSPDSRYA
jgi:hypothetical protein